MLPEPPELLEFLTPYSKEVQSLLLDLRKRMLEVLPPCIETVWDATNVVGVAFGFTEKNRDHFIHLPAYTKYVNLGFSDGASLDDPEGRLKGTGTRIRHLRMTRVEDLDDPYVLGLVQQAWMRATRPEGEVQARTIVRVMEGPKRRPTA